MAVNMNIEIATLRRMTAAQLRDKYHEVFGEVTRSGNKDFLFKRISWRMQSLAEGGLSERARQRAAELARDADIRMTMPRPRGQNTPPKRKFCPQLSLNPTGRCPSGPIERHRRSSILSGLPSVRSIQRPLIERRPCRCCPSGGRTRHPRCSRSCFRPSRCCSSHLPECGDSEFGWPARSRPRRTTRRD